MLMGWLTIGEVQFSSQLCDWPIMGWARWTGCSGPILEPPFADFEAHDALGQHQNLIKIGNLIKFLLGAL